MAARTSKRVHDEKTKRLIQASQLVNRLILHAEGKVELSPTQIQAAKIVIGKYIPDLRAVDMTLSGTVSHLINPELATDAELAKIIADGS